MKPPIIINENGDLLFFETVQDAERYVEAIDVLNNEYVAYDSIGHLLELSVQLKKEYDVVAISCIEQEPRHVYELQHILSDFFLQVEVNEEWIKKATLEDLVQKGIQEYKSV